MKRMIFTFMLAIVSSAWMANEASNWCMPSVRTLTEPWIEVNGTFQAEGFPCEPDEICPPCLTIVLVTSDKTYYLVTDDGQLIEYLDTIQLGTKATVSGIPFAHGSYDYIQVSHIETDQTSQLPSLCDEWNVLHETFSWPGGYNTFKYYLSTDTIINGKQYVKLASDKDYPYCGAFREDINANIYYIPSGSTHEYLLYAFNAQTGDTLSNLWVGGFGEDYQGVVQAISNGSPRIFIIGVKFYENSEYYSPIRWIEGVGSPETPMGLAVVPTVPADIGVFNLLCAYKNGQQVYATQLSEQFGCFYEGHNPPPTTDTIPLYAQDDPGSSTVDPVDPNQVIATLKGDELTIRDNSGEEIMMALSLSEGEASVPAFNRVQRTQSFRNELTVTLTEEGLYRLELSNPSWEYTIYGTFNYPQRKDAIDQTLVVPAAQKILRNGQLLIRIGNKVYTVHGTEIGE